LRNLFQTNTIDTSNSNDLNIFRIFLLTCRSAHDWLPRDQRVQKEWLNGIIKVYYPSMAGADKAERRQHVDEKPTKLHPVLQEFQALIEGNTRIFMLFSSMFEEIPK